MNAGGGGELGGSASTPWVGDFPPFFFVQFFFSMVTPKQWVPRLGTPPRPAVPQKNPWGCCKALLAQSLFARFRPQRLPLVWFVAPTVSTVGFAPPFGFPAALPPLAGLYGRNYSGCETAVCNSNIGLRAVFLATSRGFFFSLVTQEGVGLKKNLCPRCSRPRGPCTTTARWATTLSPSLAQALCSPDPD